MLFDKEISKLFGKLGAIQLPKWLQGKVNEAYVKHFDIDMSEFKATNEYESLNALFTRTLQKPRTLEEGFISPCDARVFELGEAFKAQSEYLAFSIKGYTYSINELLHNAYEKDELKNGCDYVNLYLSPKDYHRYHAPCDMQILSATYTSGRLFSVNEKHLKKVVNLYTQNERVMVKCKSGDFLFWLVFVGAQNVGKMRFSFDERIQTNASNVSNFTHEYDKLTVKKGDELGNFELGSTVVIIAQKGFIKFDIKADEKVKFAQKIATLL